MNPACRATLRPPRRFGVLRDALLIVSVFGSLGGARCAGAQTTQALLLQRRDAYDSVKAVYQAARSAFRALNRPFTAAINEISRATAAGDAAALDRARSDAQARAGPLQATQTRMDRLRVALDSARQALIQAIDDREDELVRAMQAATSTQERNDLNTRATDLQRQRQDLEAEAGDAPSLEPVVGLLIDPDPRDGPEENLLKARTLEAWAAKLDTVAEQVDKSIEELQGRLRRQRQRADLMAGVQRFDDTHLPVVTNAPPGDRSAAADSAGTGARPVTLQERVKGLQDYKKQLEAYRDKALIRAREFRREAGSVT